MHYVCKRVKIEYGHIENQKRFLFIQISLNGTSLKKDKICLPDEHLNHEELIS